jgi:transposase
MDVKMLHRQGASIRRIARMTGLSRVTVRRILRQAAPKPYGPRCSRPAKLSGFIGRLEELLAARPYAPATRLHEVITREGFGGHYELVKRWVRERRREETARRRACVRFETAPGLEGQFDWKGPVRGLLEREPAAEVHFFRFLLGWSRARWTLAVRSLALPAVLASLRWAFEQMGGVPRRVVLDNPKSAVLKPRPHLQLHPFFAELCRHYGCEPTPAWPYHPERKGKTERSYRDLIDSGLLERTYADLGALQSALATHDLGCMQRLHATTGEFPARRLERERAELLALPAVGFDPRLPESRRVLSDCTVSFHASFYSVPHRWVGTRVTVKADPLGDGIEIFAGAEPVATHKRAPKGHRAILPEHVAELRRPRLERLRERAARTARRPTEPDLLSMVAWPGIEVERRPIAEYAAAAGGAR